MNHTLAVSRNLASFSLGLLVFLAALAPVHAQSQLTWRRHTASNDKLSTTRPFLIIVKPDAGKGPVPSTPKGLRAAVSGGGKAVKLSWPAVRDAKAYLIYRDGVLWAAVPGGTTSFTDREWLRPGTHTRYHLSIVAASGAESAASAANPAVLSIPKKR